MLELTDVTVRFGEVPAVAGVSHRVEAGSWLGLIGPNGAGKTSLLRACARLVEHTGRVAVDDLDLRTASRRALARLVAYVPQHPELPPDMTVAEYVLLGRTPHVGFFSAETVHDRVVCAGLLDRLDLAAKAERRLVTLSGGELQRAVLARALAQQAPVLLMDEPTSALDFGRRVDALELVDQLRVERNLTVVSAMHDLTLAGQFADHLLLLAAGAIAASGPPAEVLTEDVLTSHFGTAVHVLATSDGDIVVAPRRYQARPRVP
ncbi:MAG TPA: ABC transporter ATP-binding protein [Acidimicrobiales bacterium]|nr:ABC transporter ATP-binding protein [Acidimicrobiales bacterium]